MTKLSLLFLTLLLTTASCGLLDNIIDPIEFTLTTPEVNFLLDEQEAAGTTTLVVRDLSLGIPQELDDEDVSTSRLTSLRPESITLRLVELGDVDLSVIEDASVRIEAAGLAPITFASGDLALNAANTEATLDVRDVDIADALLAPSADYFMTVTTNAPVPEATEIAVSMQLRGEAEAL